MGPKWVPLHRRANFRSTYTENSFYRPSLIEWSPLCLKDTIILNHSPCDNLGCCGCSAGSPITPDCTQVNLVLAPVQHSYALLLLKVIYRLSIHVPTKETIEGSKFITGDKSISGEESAEPPDADVVMFRIRPRDIMKIREHFEQCFLNIDMGLHPSLSSEKTSLKSCATSTVKVKSVIRLGKVLFFSPVDGRQLDHLNPLCVELVQREVRGEKALKERVWRNLETNLLDSLFTKLSSLVEKEVNMKVKIKESYMFQVVDSAQDDAIFRIHCRPISHQQNGSEAVKLQIFKVRTSPCRHMVLDIVRLGGDCDFRTTVWSERTYHDGDVWRIFQPLVDAAILDPSVKGGVRWPPDAVHQWNDRFTLISIRRSFEGWRYAGKGLTWRLKRVDGLDVEQNSSRQSMEVEITPWAWKKSMRDLNSWKDGEEDGRVDKTSNVKENWNQSSLLDSLPSVLEWMCTHLP